ncbi:MAG: RluA family pseudouridine synthase [Candidatus Tectimicrobiota bacterium]
MEPQHLTFLVSVEAHGLRLDKYLAGQVPELSRSQVQRLIQEGQVQTAHGPASASYRVHQGERIALHIPPPRPARPLAEALDLHIVYEDDALLVINKPPGLVVHPAPGHASGTLVNALLFHCQSLSGVGGEVRPGIVHRLDKDTSGLMLVAKHDRSHRWLAAQLKEHHIQRRYLALVRGQFASPQGTIDAPIGRHPHQRQKMAVVARAGRAARTHYQVLETWSGLSLLRLSLETGRTHQIRVHLAHIAHAVVGDPVYGAGLLHLPGHPQLAQALNSFPRQALHAEHLRFQHPETAAWLEFSVAVPADLAALLTRVRQAAPCPSPLSGA